MIGIAGVRRPKTVECRTERSVRVQLRSFLLLARLLTLIASSGFLLTNNRSSVAPTWTVESICRVSGMFCVIFAFLMLIDIHVLSLCIQTGRMPLALLLDHPRRHPSLLLSQRSTRAPTRPRAIDKTLLRPNFKRQRRCTFHSSPLLPM